MEPGRNAPQPLAETMPSKQPEWSALVRRHRLCSPESLVEFVGQGFTYVDRILGHDRPQLRPTLVSTIKARQGGFADCMDTEAMVAKWFARFQEERLLPPRTDA
jgi:hypothetical protein